MRTVFDEKKKIFRKESLTDKLSKLFKSDSFQLGFFFAIAFIAGLSFWSSFFGFIGE